MSDHSLNQQKLETFGERLTGMLNEGSLAHMLSIGHRTGLFDRLAILPPATSCQIAEAAGLNERYVREWLNALTVGDILTYDPEQETYHLPAEHAQLLTRTAGADNMALYMQHVSSFGAVESQIVACFQNGGGVPYEAYERFHEIMAEDSGVNVVAALIDQILPLVPGLIDRLTAGIQVLDIGCGRGRAIHKMAQAFPNSQFYGYDLSEEAIGFAQQETAVLGLQNVSFMVQDMTDFNAGKQYDLITAFDAIHDQAFPARVLGKVQRALKPEGVFLMQDIAASSQVEANVDQPFAPFLYTISTMHCMTVSLAQGGVGLGTMWGQETALRLLEEAGFGRLSVQQLPHDFMNDYYVAYP
jgi:2-polyprenyl-3-methyl-5-hydroxy-6-metoxy-1,4-benzoquinol methylase